MTSSTTGFRRLLAAGSAVLLLIVGCGSESDEAHGSDPSDCAKLEAITPPADAPTTALVVDNTATSSMGGLPPRIRKELESAQTAGNRLVLVPVEGEGRSTSLVRTVALEPNPGKDTQAADNARPVVLDCVARWAREENMRPTSPGSDILSAVTTAGRQNPDRILVMSDGINNVGQFDVNHFRFDSPPTAVAGALAGAGALAPELADQRIVWTGLGETVVALPQQARNYLEDVWREVLVTGRAKVEFDKQVGSRGTPPDGLPEDLLTVPEVGKLVLDCGVHNSIPGALLFGGNSDELQPEADQLLRVIVDQLAQQPGAYAVIEGHTAAFGPDDGRQPFSEQRARSVADALVRLGVDRSRTDVRGYGSTRPLPGMAPTAPDNRRVEITVGTKGCTR